SCQTCPYIRILWSASHEETDPLPIQMRSSLRAQPLCESSVLKPRQHCVLRIFSDRVPCPIGSGTAWARGIYPCLTSFLSPNHPERPHVRWNRPQRPGSGSSLHRQKHGTRPSGPCRVLHPQSPVLLQG